VKLLDRYIGLAVIRGFVLVALVLTSMFSILEFVNQLNDVGEGRYQISDALLYVLLTAPSRLLQLIPVSGLMGSLVALGAMANTNELTAMQALGVPVGRIVWSVLKPGAMIMLALLLVAEFVVPRAEQLAQSERALTIAQTPALRSENGFWARDAGRFVNVRKFVHGEIPTDIDIYTFDDGGRLKTFIHADRGEIRPDGTWLLTNVKRKLIDAPHIRTERLDTLTWKSFLHSRQVHLVILAPESMAPTELYQYINDLKRRRQQTDRYEQALWKKISLPLATAAMVLISIPFVFGPLRTESAGQRIMLGTALGIVFYLTNQITGYLGLLLDFNAAATAMTPSILLLTAALYLLRRSQ